MKIKTISLRASLLAITLVMALGLGALAALNAVEAWRDLRDAQAMQANNETADLLLVSAGAWALERGITNAALNAPEASEAQTRARIAELRERADTAFAAAMERVRSGHAFSAKETLLARTQRDFEALASLRRAVDEAITHPQETRDAAVAPRWVPTATAAIMSSQELRLASQLISDTTLARAQLVQDVKNAVWIMSEFAGRERAALGALIADNQSIGAAELSRLAGLRGRIEQAWMTIQSYAIQDFAAAEILQGLERVNEAFFVAFERTREGVYAAGTSSGAYPLTAARWIEESTRAIDTVLDLSRTVSEVASTYTLQSAAEGRQSFTLNLALLLTAIAIAALSFWIVLARVTLPINRLTRVMSRLAEGDNTIAIPSVERGDEIGAMARAVQIFKDNAIETEQLRARQEETERRAEEEKRRAMIALADAFEGDVGEVITTLTGASRELDATAQSMRSIAEQTSERSTAVAAASTQASTNVHTVAAATEELSKSIAEINQQVSASTAMARSAVGNAETANNQVRGLAEAAEKIGAVVDLIQDIAEQTNLLALNATIEAARAGDAGKGFAVVASEVKSLANQTAKATQDIAEHISRVQRETRDAVGGIEQITDTIRQIDEIAASIASAVEQQGAATQEIARNVQEAAAGTESVNSNIGGVSEAAGETGAAAEQLVQAVGDLGAKADLLSQRVGGFLEQVRAA